MRPLAVRATRRPRARQGRPRPPQSRAQCLTASTDSALIRRDVFDPFGSDGSDSRHPRSTPQLAASAATAMPETLSVDPIPFEEGAGADGRSAGEAFALLFTDIVDSTALAERLGDAATAALWSAHDRARARPAARLARPRDRQDRRLAAAVRRSRRCGSAMPLAYHRALASLRAAAAARAPACMSAAVDAAREQRRRHRARRQAARGRRRSRRRSPRA